MNSLEHDDLYRPLPSTVPSVLLLLLDVGNTEFPVSGTT
jgi:hypothetical protein